MRGVLTPEQQLEVLAKIWGPPREGYVFLPWVDGDAVDAADRRRKFHEGPAYAWPEDRSKILMFLNGHADDDVFFAPCTFELSRRASEVAQPERVLWADIDDADVHSMDEWRPTIAWESSPGRYQGVWLLGNEARVGMSWAGKENQRLTLQIGADPSGYDTTQLLRVPGRPNYKPEYRAANGGRPSRGELLWTNGPRYKLADLDALPKITLVGVDDVEMDLLDDAALSSVDRRDVWGRVRLKVSAKVREYVATKSAAAVESADRSEVVWQIARDLADAGCTLAEIVVVLRATAWNKYAGRNDEVKQLKVVAAKAIGEARTTPPTLEEEFEVVDRGAPVTMAALLGGRRTRPKWLVHNVWSEGGVGFVSGVPKSYKSWVALDLAVSVATGRPFLGAPEHVVMGDGTGSPVLYVQEEDSEAAVVRNAEAVVMGRDPELHPWGVVEMGASGATWRPGAGSLHKLHTYVRRGFRISDGGWQVWLDETLAELGVKLLVVDTLGTTAGEVDLDKASDVQNKVLRPMRQLAAKHGCAIAVVHHNNKANDNTRAGQRLLGSTALHAWVEDALYVTGKERHRDGWRVAVERESKSAPERRFKIEVPRMGTMISHTADGRRTEAGFREDWRVWWQPTVVEELEDVGVESTVDVDPKQRATKPPANRRGGYLYNVVKNLGSNGRRAVSFSAIAQNLGDTEAECRKKLRAAVAAGVIVGDETAGYKLP